MKIHRLSIPAAVLALVACSSDAEEYASGTFEATEVTVSAEASGRILAFDLEEGDIIEGGQLLGAVDSIQLHLQKLQLERQRASVQSGRPDEGKQVAALRSQIAQAEREKARIEGLLKDGAATQKSLDDVNAQISILQAQLAASQSSLRSSAAAVDEHSSALELQIAQVEDLLGKCRIVSPVRGTVLARYARAGEMTAPGKPLFKVADLDTLYLRAYFTSDQLPDIRIGQEVTVRADFGADRQFDYPGRITWIASESEFTPKTIQTKDSRANLVYAVKIAVPNDGRLKIGLSGSVIL